MPKEPHWSLEQQYNHWKFNASYKLLTPTPTPSRMLCAKFSWTSSSEDF